MCWLDISLWKVCFTRLVKKCFGLEGELSVRETDYHVDLTQDWCFFSYVQVTSPFYDEAIIVLLIEFAIWFAQMLSYGCVTNVKTPVWIPPVRFPSLPCSCAILWSFLLVNALLISNWMSSDHFRRFLVHEIIEDVTMSTCSTGLPLPRSHLLRLWRVCRVRKHVSCEASYSYMFLHM